MTLVNAFVLARSSNLSTVVAPSSLNLQASLTGCQRLVHNTSYTVTGMKQYTLQISTSVTVSEGTTSIGTAQYYGCPISSLIIPSSVVSIGAYAFSYSSLATVNIPTSVTNIGTTIITIIPMK